MSKVHPIKVTPAQAYVADCLMSHFDRGAGAQAVLCLIDVTADDKTMRWTATTDATALCLGAAVLLLRNSLSLLLRQQDELPGHARLIEAVRTALPYLETAGIAEPEPTQGGLQ